MIVQKVSFDHRDILMEKFKQLQFYFSEYSFANIYLFRKIHEYEIVTLDQHIFIKGITRDRIPFIMLVEVPSASYIQSLQKVLDEYKINLLFPVREEWIGTFDKKLIQASFKSDDSDYLFLKQKLMTYSGKGLGYKRKLVDRFLDTHQAKTIVLTLDNLGYAKTILDEWQTSFKKRDGNHLQMETDYDSCFEALELFSSLNLNGRLLFADDQPIGFVIGERLVNDCYVIHFIKSFGEISGGYQYLLQDFVNALDEKIIWVNLEQDLGVQSLRQSKWSYSPDKLLYKWRVEIQGR